MKTEKLKKILKKFIDQEVDPVCEFETGYKFGYDAIDDFIERREKEKAEKDKYITHDGHELKDGDTFYVVAVNDKFKIKQFIYWSTGHKKGSIKFTFSIDSPFKKKKNEVYFKSKKAAKQFINEGD